MDSDPQNSEKSDSVFVWDENSQLYFHASSGFYHDPNAGWYYSTRDGLYYKFEDGNYVLLDSNKDDHRGGTYPCEEATREDPKQTCANSNEDCPPAIDGKFEAYQPTGALSDEPAADPMNSMSSPTCENPPPPPSEWLEDTLIDLYLSGYNNMAVTGDDDTVTVPLETDDGYNSKLAADGIAYSNIYEVDDKIPDSMDETVDKSNADEGIAYDDTYELEEGEWIPDPEDLHGTVDRSAIDEGILLDEEKWRAQYGQVIESRENLVSEFPTVDLWDWEMVRGSKKDGKDKVARLVGRLVKQSAKRHPSIASGGGKFRSAPISEVHLDLVRVKTGQVYRLRNPSARYVASLSTYDSANPTEDWDFPQLSPNRKITGPSKSAKSTTSASDEIPMEKDLSMLPNPFSASKQTKCQYRDRAAERRVLHGGFGVGPGQKNPVDSYNDTPSSPSCPQDAASEALEMSFGAGSYARKLLENMGWKEGEGLGSSTKGLVEPIQPVGNIGSAGLGWRRN